MLAGAYDHRAAESFEALHAELVAPVSGVSSAATADRVYPPPPAAPCPAPPKEPASPALPQARFPPELGAPPPMPRPPLPTRGSAPGSTGS